ncbi:MAG: hypothetical protein IT445_04755 [Phycisphaeraceae bacterium]|nr:hypothetical protein [Phycisphaeraceae bacterium]
MDKWSIISIGLVVPAVLFLIIAAAVSSLRMSRQHIQALLMAGLIALPAAIACVWMRDQTWLNSPWESAIDIVGNVAGLIIAYALIAVVTLAIRHGVRVTRHCS